MLFIPLEDIGNIFIILLMFKFLTSTMSREGPTKEFNY